mmetsp:Transcript_45174/g.107501  ORF Transcript_45174/g.107501 Transcript_45174/m.107501 type:complete len:390 (+) Transcript_45174:1331-2500(+)
MSCASSSWNTHKQSTIRAEVTMRSTDTSFPRPLTRKRAFARPFTANTALDITAVTALDTAVVTVLHTTAVTVLDTMAVTVQVITMATKVHTMITITLASDHTDPQVTIMDIKQVMSTAQLTSAMLDALGYERTAKGRSLLLVRTTEEATGVSFDQAAPQAGVPRKSPHPRLRMTHALRWRRAGRVPLSLSRMLQKAVRLAESQTALLMNRKVMVGSRLQLILSQRLSSRRAVLNTHSLQHQVKQMECWTLPTQNSLRPLQTPQFLGKAHGQKRLEPSSSMCQPRALAKRPLSQREQRRQSRCPKLLSVEEVPFLLQTLAFQDQRQKFLQLVLTQWPVRQLSHPLLLRHPPLSTNLSRFRQPTPRRRWEKKPMSSLLEQRHQRWQPWWRL